MKLWEAIKALEEGKKIRCLKWPKNEYWILSQSNSNIWDDSFYRIKLCVLCNWGIYEEPGLTFSQVIEGLKEGKRFRRREWINQNYHISTELGMGVLNMTGLSPIFDIMDFEAKDWEEVK